MTYNTNTPKSTDLISATQVPINTNFFQADAQFGTDHNNFNNGGTNGNGHHKQVTFDIALGADPIPATSTSSLIYPKSVSNPPVAAAIQPFFINNLGNPAQLCGDYYTYTPVLTSQNRTFNYTSQLGYYYVAGGVTFFFGTIVTSTETQTNPPGSSFTMTLPSAVVNFGTCNFNFVYVPSTFQVIKIITIPSGSSTVTIPFAINASSNSPTTYFFNGFYI